MGETQYKELVSSVEFSKDSIMYIDVSSDSESLLQEFMPDMEEKNDAIELHLIRTKAYKEAVILHLNQTKDVAQRKAFLEEEQKTFGGSKIFYFNADCSKLLALSVKDEIMNKLQMVLTRLNKVNGKISRYNSQAKQENQKWFESSFKSEQEMSKQDQIAYYIHKELKN